MFYLDAQFLRFYSIYDNKSNARYQAIRNSKAQDKTILTL